MADKPLVSIIIPTLRAGDDLGNALKSVDADKSSPSHEVIVVFNCPKPIEMDLRAFHMNARSLQAVTNLGFAAGCNYGAKEAVGDYLVFLNDDMTIEPGWLDGLVSKMIHDETEVVGGRIVSPDGKKVDFEGGSINLLGWGFQKGHGDEVGDDAFDIPSRIPFACGGNFAIKTELFESAGMFDEDYFAYYEDVDLGWRLRLMGHEISYAPKATAYHNAGATGGHLPKALKWFMQERNALQSIIKNYSDDLFNRIFPVACALVSVRSMIMSGLEASDFAPDRSWREWVINPDTEETEQKAVWNWLVDNVKESLKSGMKNSRKASTPPNYLPVDNRGVAGMYALEWTMANWEHLMEKRAAVQSMRKKPDAELVGMFDDAVRPVLGHPREIEAMKPLEKLLEDLVKGE